MFLENLDIFVIKKPFVHSIYWEYLAKAFDNEIDVALCYFFF
jgi:hypothetical protein